MMRSVARASDARSQSAARTKVQRASSWSGACDVLAALAYEAAIAWPDVGAINDVKGNAAIAMKAANQRAKRCAAEIRRVSFRQSARARATARPCQRPATTMGAAAWAKESKRVVTFIRTSLSMRAWTRLWIRRFARRARRRRWLL